MPRRKSTKLSRSCILTSRRDNTTHSFLTLADADTFLGRQHGYLSGKIRSGACISRIDEEGELEFFDVSVGPQLRVKIEYDVCTPQLCWSCNNCYDGCSWSRSFKPVRGWTAKPSIKDGDVTYKISQCPEYDPDSSAKLVNANGTMWIGGEE